MSHRAIGPSNSISGERRRLGFSAGEASAIALAVPRNIIPCALQQGRFKSVTDVQGLAPETPGGNEARRLGHLSFNIDRTPRNRLHWLLDLLLANELTAESFCQEFGRTYVDIADADLSAAEHQAFADLFSVTKLHATALQRLHDSYPGRKSDDDVRRAVQQAKALLRHELS
jgi:hypothetical protein